MVSIRIGRWLLKSDPHCWQVGKYRTRTYEGGRVSEEVVDPKYPSTLRSALNHLLDQELRESDARSLDELRQTVEAFEREVKEALKTHPTVPRNGVDVPVEGGVCARRGQGRGREVSRVG